MTTEDTLLRTLLVVALVVLIAPFLVMVLVMPVMGLWGWGHMWNGGAWAGAGSTWMWLLMWLVFLTIVGGVGYLLYGLTSRPAGRETDPALEELRTAYARGELSDEEFEQRRERLRREQ